MLLQVTKSHYQTLAASGSPITNWGCWFRTICRKSSLTTSWALCFASPAVLDLLRSRSEDRLDDALRKSLVRSEADRADRGIVSIEHLAQRAQRRTAPDEQPGMTLGCPETRQRVAVQFEEGHTVADVLRGFGVELFDLPVELL